MTKKKSGFASMPPERVREISSLGGRTAHQLGTAHKWTPEEAQKAGRIGGARGRRGKAKKEVA